MWSDTDRRLVAASAACIGVAVIAGLYSKQLLNMGLVSRIVFYPSLVYNVVLEKVTSRNWFDHIDETVILGALPFRSMTKQLVEVENVRGIVTTNEAFETQYLCNSAQEWERLGVEQLCIPTADLTTSPSLSQLHTAVHFIEKFKGTGGKVYVHCKAGRTRSATVVAAYLIQTHGWSPERAVSHVQEKRPHVWFRGIQLQALEEFAALQQRSSAGDDSH